MPGSELSKSDRETSEWKPEFGMLRSTMAKIKSLNVGIVGAGFAGLRCADVLLQHGHKVTIFEARDRVGGRVAQSNHLGHLVDLGPNWIHGTEGNPISKIAQKTGTKLHAWEESQHIIDTDGSSLPPEEAMEYGQILWDDGLIAEAFKYSNENKNSIPVETSLYDFFEERVAKMFQDLPAEQAEKKRKALLNVANMWGAYVGSPVTRQSLRFYWLEECIEGENPFVAETYHKILDEVAKVARGKGRILLNHKVNGITSRQGPDSRPSISTADGKPEEFDEVVVTTPLGWLKRNKTAFKPSLEPRIEKAIDSIGYGCLDKVYITFPSAFWERGFEPSTLSTSQSNQGLDSKGSTPNVTATTAPVHQPSSDDSSSNYPGFAHWLSPTYSPNTNPSQWDQQGMNMAALPGSTAHPTILFYIYGPCSQHIASLLTSNPPSEHDALLLSFFEPYYSLLPNYSADDPACKPAAVLATAWANDEFAGYGSYSNFQIGLEEGDKDIDAIRYGMPEKGIWFAGEHTAPFVALGTTTGAYWSGEGVAERIMERYVGGTGGIGESTLRELFKRTVRPTAYIVGRSDSRASAIAREAEETSDGGKCHFIKADVKTSEGIDRKMSVNYYARARFMFNLMPQLTAAAEAGELSRVNSVLAAGSEGKIRVDDLQLRDNFTLHACLAHCVVMTDFLMEEFARRYPGTAFFHSYPGTVKTGIAQNLTGPVRLAVKVLYAVSSPWIIQVQESGERHLFQTTSTIYPPRNGGVGVPPSDDKLEVTIGSDGERGSGAYLLDWDGQSTGDANLLREHRQNGLNRIVWEHTQEIFKKAVGNKRPADDNEGPAQPIRNPPGWRAA
ncbi:hypothetical protein MBLNU457_6756t1 [Dothideomycetes sp. NU457]